MRRAVVMGNCFSTPSRVLQRHAPISMPTTLRCASDHVCHGRELRVHCATCGTVHPLGPLSPIVVGDFDCDMRSWRLLPLPEAPRASMLRTPFHGAIVFSSGPLMQRFRVRLELCVAVPLPQSADCGLSVALLSSLQHVNRPLT